MIRGKMRLSTHKQGLVMPVQALHLMSAACPVFSLTPFLIFPVCMCVYGGHPGPLITGAVWQQLERLECILGGYINQCVITSTYRDRLAKKQDERHRHQVNKRLRAWARF